MKDYSSKFYYLIFLIILIIVTPIHTYSKNANYQFHLIFEVSSKTHKVNKITYAPIYAFDNNLKTTWAVEVQNKNKISLNLDLGGMEPINIEKIGIFPGFGIFKSKYGNLFKANHRLKNVKIEVGEYSKNVIFNDIPEIRYFEFNKKNVHDIDIYISDYYKGNKYNDICISEVKIIPQGGLRKKKNYYNYLSNTHGMFPRGIFHFKKGGLLIGSTSDPAFTNAIFKGTWKVTGNKLLINFSIVPRDKNKQEKIISGPFKVKAFIQGVMKNNRLLMVSEVIPR